MASLPPPGPGPFTRALAAVIAVLLGIGLFMFSLVIVVIALGVGLVFGGWFWWRTRKLRATLREQMKAAAQGAPAAWPSEESASVIEGEYVRVDEIRRLDDRHDDPPGSGA